MAAVIVVVVVAVVIMGIEVATVAIVRKGQKTETVCWP